MGSKVMSDPDDYAVNAQAAQMLDELKEELRKAMALAEDYRRQIHQLQSRLDEASHEQERLEVQLHERDEKIGGLEGERRDLLRQRRELEETSNAERAFMTEEKERMTDQEQQLRSIIQRLKETLAQKSSRGSPVTDEPKHEDDISPHANGSFAPSLTASPRTSRQNSTETQEKNKIIDTLRSQLAETQSRLVEAEETKDERVQELEEALQGSRMTIAKLIEDSESYQLLLNEKTLNGDFSRNNVMRVSDSGASDDSEGPQGAMSPSLADELHSVNLNEDEHHDRLEAEIKGLKDQNKALSLYINHILERLLQHKDCESILDKTPNLLRAPSSTSVPTRSTKKVNTDKELPVTPPREEQSAVPRPRQAGPSVLRSSPGPGPRSRPLSFVSVSPPGASPADGSSTASSTHMRRSSSIQRPGTRVVSFERPDSTSPLGPAKNDQSSTSIPASRTSAAIPASRRYSLFSTMSSLGPLVGGGSGGSSGAGTRTPSGNQSLTEKSESGSTGPINEPNTNAAQDTTHHATIAPSSHVSTSTTNSTAPAMGGNKLRPLRLVQGQAGQNQQISEAEMEAAKKARRSSWMGWFNKGKPDDAQGQGMLPHGAEVGPMGGRVVRE